MRLRGVRYFIQLLRSLYEIVDSANKGGRLYRVPGMLFVAVRAMSLDNLSMAIDATGGMVIMPAFVQNDVNGRREGVV